MSSYQEEAKQETQQLVTGLLNTEGLLTVFDKCLSISQIEDKVESLMEQMEELKKADMLGRLEALENDLATHKKETKEKDERSQKQIKQLQKAIDELVNWVDKENLPPIGTLPESTPQQKSTPSSVHDDSGYQSTHSIRSKPTVSGKQELNIKLEYNNSPDDDSIAPSSTH